MRQTVWNLRKALGRIAVVLSTMMAPCLAAAETYIVTSDTAVLRQAPTTDSAVVVRLPRGTYVDGTGHHDRYVIAEVRYADRSLKGYVWGGTLSAARAAGPNDLSYQSLLIATGFLAGKADGKFGPKSRDALGRYLASRDLPASTPRSAALFNDLLLSFDQQQAGPRLKAEQRAAATALFNAGRCGEFAKLDYDARDGRDQGACDSALARRSAEAAIRSRLSEGDCDAAEALNAAAGGRFAPEIGACRAAAATRAAERALAAAVSAGDCDAVARHEATLGRSGAARSCRIDAAMAAGTAREMYLAAGSFDVAGDRAAARRIYEATVARFPGDDMALKSMERLLALRDAEAAEDRARALEAENERLRRDAEAARAAADAAAEQARRAAQAAPRPRSGACDHLAAGQRIRHIPSTSNPVGFFVQGGLYGTDFRIEALNHYTGIAHLRSLDTGRYLDMRCRDLGR